jgi:hypothetical protein
MQKNDVPTAAFFENLKEMNMYILLLLAQR